MASQSSVCCFCQEPFGIKGRTAEHVIPQWLLRDSGVKNSDTYQFISVKETQQQRNTRAYSHIYRRVCGSCNSGWMSALEAHIQRVIHRLSSDSPTQLNFVDRLLMNAWMFKIIALTHLTEGGDRAEYVRKQDLATLAKRLLPEGQSFLAVARTLEPRAARVSLHLFQNHFVTSKEEAEQPNLSLTQCFCGMLRIFDLLLFFAYMPPGDAWALDLDKRLNKAVRLWPNQTDVLFDRTHLPLIENAENMDFRFVRPEFAAEVVIFR